MHKIIKWSDIVQISANENQTVGLKCDGIVVSTSYDESYKSQQSKWADVNSILYSSSNVFGLKTDGTVIIVGYQSNYCDTSGWKDIIAIFPAHDNLLDLADGIVITTNQSYSGLNEGSGKVKDWKVKDWKGIAVPII